jgi:hypothetical protein
MISNNVFSDAAQENANLGRAAATATFKALYRRLVAQILPMKTDSREKAIERLIAARGQDRISESLEREIFSIYERFPPSNRIF